MEFLLFHDRGDLSYAAARLAVMPFIPAIARAAAPFACGGRLLFVSGKRGAYLAGVQWRVLDRSNEPLAYGTAEGPQCRLRLPPGPLHIEARVGNETKTAKAVAPKAGKPARVVLTFAPEAGEDIEASPEEKQQGRR